MSTTNSRMAELVIEHMSGSLSEPDSIELNQILLDPKKKKLFEELMDPDRTRKAVKRMQEGEKYIESSWKAIEDGYFRPRERKKRRKKALIGSAIIIGFVVIYYLLSRLKTN